MTFDTVRKMLEETREQGYSVIPGILAPGFWGIGVPVGVCDRGFEIGPVLQLIVVGSGVQRSRQRCGVESSDHIDHGQPVGNRQGLAAAERLAIAETWDLEI